MPGVKQAAVASVLAHAQLTCVAPTRRWSTDGTGTTLPIYRSKTPMCTVVLVLGCILAEQCCGVGVGLHPG